MTKLGKTSFLIFIFGIILLSLTLIYVWDPYSLTEKHPAITIFVVLSIFFVCGIALQYKLVGRFLICRFLIL
jgi:hypothetical protein